MDYLISHAGKIATLVGELIAAMAGLTAAIVGLCSIIVNRLIPVLEKDHPALGVVKVMGTIGNAFNNTPVKETDRPTAVPTVPPSGPAAAVILLFCLLCAPAHADVNIGTVLSNAGAKEGILYDANAKRGLNFLAATVAEQGEFSLLAGLVSTDGIGAAIDYNAGKALPKVNFPVLSLVNDLHVGVGGYVRTVTVHTDTVENSKADNKWGWGPSLFVKWNF